MGASEIAFIPGHPPLETSVAWLLMRSDDGEGGVSDATVLALREGDDWYEAGDWKAESTLDSVHACRVSPRRKRQGRRLLNQIRTAIF